ncbi:MAG: hypothetical protein HY001_02160 [Candidatus Portnoybacteria bacterium]|nr:hypothetical protein [Candidatus Portnoybacteria bacterium]
MSEESRRCQNCKQSFAIEPEDYKFYEKIQVPPPTWCPECRLIRRMSGRNERMLYQRPCDAPGHHETLFSIYSTDKPLMVYCQKFWWSESWDPIQWGQEYNFSKPFFLQFIELLKSVPLPALDSGSLGTVIRSDYCNDAWEVKDCYFSSTIGRSENCYYDHWVVSSKYVVDSFFTTESESCYECIDCKKCYNVRYAQYAQNCIDSTFLFDCKDCIDCFYCVGLRHKSYHIFNKPYSKEEYHERVRKLWEQGIVTLKDEFGNFSLTYPRRYAYITKSQQVVGHNVQNSKNCYVCFDTQDAEDSKYLSRNILGTKDCQDLYSSGEHTELSYDTAVTGINTSRVLFSNYAVTGHKIQYSLNTNNSSNIFGCISLRNKQYCILNKQYTKEDYKKLIPAIIEHMNEMPYVDRKGRVYKYGEFFPPELSPFAYNETIAQECFPLTKEQALEKGYQWKDREVHQRTITVIHSQLPDHIKDVPDSITNEIIQCAHASAANSNQPPASSCNEQCTTAFRIIPQELKFYRKMNLPLPRLCPNCRHYQRLKQRNPLKLWHRRCTCQGPSSTNGVYKNTIEHFHKANPCPNEFETSYAPEREEIVYCERCYLAEVA